MPRMNAASDANLHAMREAGAAARAASAVLARASDAMRAAALLAAADALLTTQAEILDANAADIAAFKGSGAFLDRLRLDERRVAAMAEGLRAVAALPDPLGRTLAQWTRPNGLVISRIAQPLGVLGMIYESAAQCAADAAALCVKSGNAVLLRGGSECFRSSLAIHAALCRACGPPDLPEAAVQIAPSTDRGGRRGDAGG